MAFPEVPAGVGHDGEGLGAGETRDDVGVSANDSVINICNDNDSRRRRINATERAQVGPRQGWEVGATLNLLASSSFTNQRGTSKSRRFLRYPPGDRPSDRSC